MSVPSTRLSDVSFRQHWLSREQSRPRTHEGWPDGCDLIPTGAGVEAGSDLERPMTEKQIESPSLVSCFVSSSNALCQEPMFQGWALFMQFTTPRSAPKLLPASRSLRLPPATILSCHHGLSPTPRAPVIGRFISKISTYTRSGSCDPVTGSYSGIPGLWMHDDT